MQKHFPAMLLAKTAKRRKARKVVLRKLGGLGELLRLGEIKFESR